MAKQKIQLLLLGIICLILISCASSSVSRNAASNVDFGVQNAQNLVSNPDDADITDSYQNSSQATKGVMLGGATGAISGALMSGVGFIPGLATGAILGGSYGSYIDSYASLQDQLINRGANVIVLGDQILVAIPSDRLFKSFTPTIKPTAYSTLNVLARYLNQYTKTLVKISVYTNDTGSASVDLALSQQQADSLEKFLTLTGLDARVLAAAGYGGTHQVVRNSSDWDSDNYRVEITLEKLYV